MEKEDTTKRSKALSSSALTVIGLISVALGAFLKEYSFIAIVGIITLPIAFVRFYRERKKRKNSEFKFGIIDSSVVIVVAVAIVMLILNII